MHRPSPIAALFACAACVVACAAAACARPIHRRTHVFDAPRGVRGEHPADVPETAAHLALVGRVDRHDLPGMARAVSRAFRGLRPDQVVAYVHPDGGAVHLFVDQGELVVDPVGVRARAGMKRARYPLSDLRRAASARAARPPKAADLDEAIAIEAPHAELEVTATFALEQFVFIDAVYAGSVAPGESRVFPLAPGDHVIVAADAADGATNAIRLELKAESGRRYPWTIVTRL